MHRGQLAAAAVAAAALLVPGAAEAAGPLKGTVQRGWVAGKQGGAPRSIFPPGTTRLVASFVWLRPPTPGQALTISWIGPDGDLRAIWRNRTIKGDRRGTRIWTSIANETFREVPGRWYVVLRVGGVRRGTLRFVVQR
jgi:hypothetical protein